METAIKYLLSVKGVIGCYRQGTGLRPIMQGAGRLVYTLGPWLLLALTGPVFSVDHSHTTGMVYFFHAT